MRLDSGQTQSTLNVFARIWCIALVTLGMVSVTGNLAAAGPLDDVENGFAFTIGATGLVESGTEERMVALSAVVIADGDSVADPGEDAAGFILSAAGTLEVTDDDDVVAVLESGDATFVDSNSDLEITATSGTATLVRFAILDEGDQAPWDGDDDVIDLDIAAMPGSGEDAEQAIALRFALLTDGVQASIGDGDHSVPVVISLAGDIALSGGDSVTQGNLAVNPDTDSDGGVGLTAASESAYVVALVIGPDLNQNSDQNDDSNSGSSSGRPTPTPEANDGVIPGTGDEDPDPEPDQNDDTPDEDEPELNELDTDSDGISDDGERDLYSTDPNNPDSDGDGLTDGQEVFSEFFPTDPNLFDTDGDGLGDNDELNNAAGPLNPLVADCDGDGLLDGDEVNSTGTAPCIPDTDGDSLGDFDELVGANGFPSTNPLVFDTDGDGFSDGLEVLAGSNPVDPNSVPTT